MTTTCEVCEHSDDPTTRRRLDPFQQDVWDREVLRDLCDRCTQGLSDDI